MEYGLQMPSLATVTSGARQLVSVDADPGPTKIRVLDVVLLNTASAISLYSGTSSAAANLLLVADKNNPLITGSDGFTFSGGVYAYATTGVGNLATVTYVREF